MEEAELEQVAVQDCDAGCICDTTWYMGVHLSNKPIGRNTTTKLVIKQTTTTSNNRMNGLVPNTHVRNQTIFRTTKLYAAPSKPHRAPSSPYISKSENWIGLEHCESVYNHKRKLNISTLWKIATNLKQRVRADGEPE